MPFKSKNQQGYLFKNNPKVAREMASKMKPEDYDTLPEKVGQDKIHEAAKRRSSKRRGK